MFFITLLGFAILPCYSCFCCQDKWRNLSVSTASHGSREKSRQLKVKLLPAPSITNTPNSAPARAHNVLSDTTMEDPSTSALDGKNAPRFVSLFPTRQKLQQSIYEIEIILYGCKLFSIVVLYHPILNVCLYRPCGTDKILRYIVADKLHLLNNWHHFWEHSMYSFHLCDWGWTKLSYSLSNFHWFKLSLCTLYKYDKGRPKLNSSNKLILCPKNSCLFSVM